MSASGVASAPDPDGPGEAPAVRPPRQRRSRETLDRIVHATAELLDERTFDELTVDEIVERSGSSKGAFYNRFVDKESLLRHLRDEHFGSRLAVWSDYLDPRAWEDRPLREFVDELVARVIGIYRTRTGLMRAFVLHARLHPDPDANRRGRQLNRHVALAVGDLFALWSDEIRHDDLHDAARFAIATIVAVAKDAILFPAEADRDRPSDRKLAGDLGRLIYAYLVTG